MLCDLCCVTRAVWRLFCETCDGRRVIKVIHDTEPNWIIFFEGMPYNYWWGGNVTALLKAPIKLKVQYVTVHKAPGTVLYCAAADVTLPA